MMAKKTLEKTTASAQSGTQKFYCCRCGRAYGRQKGYFPVSHSPMYRGSGHLPFCNECVEEMYEGYIHELGDPRAAMRRICMKLDLYWNGSIYDMAERSCGTNSMVRNYIGKTNIVRYIDKTFDDTLREEARDGSDRSGLYTAAESEEGGDDTAEAAQCVNTPQEVVDFWGGGFSDEFYAELERRYGDWMASVPEPEKLSHTERSLYRQICMLEASISRDSARGKPIDKSVNTLNTLLGSMNLKPTQKKEELDGELENLPLGVGIQKWENSRPLPPTPEELRDTSGLVKNITTWFLGHACKMVGLRNSYCKMYEQAIEKYRVKFPEFSEEDDDDMLSDIFSSAGSQEEAEAP